MDKLISGFLKLVYTFETPQVFNEELKVVLARTKMTKTSFAKKVYEILKKGEALPQTSQEALRLLTYMPFPYLRKEEVFNKLLPILNDADKKKIPDATTVWGEQPIRATVTAGLLDFPRKKLPDAVFQNDPENPLPQMQPELRALILSEARRRLSQFGAELIGANLYGGAASYQYHEGADIDVSLYIDWDNFKGNRELLEQAFKQVEIPYHGFKLHLFIKPDTQREQVEVADAVYDVFHDEWKIAPLILPKDFDPDIFFKPLIEMAEKKAQDIDVQMGIVAREWVKLKKAVQSRAEGPRDEEAVQKRIDIQKVTVNDEVRELCRMFVDIWTGRRRLHDELRSKYVQNRDVDKFERFQYPEVVWKYLDQAGYCEFLKLLAKAQDAGVIDTLLNEI